MNERTTIRNSTRFSAECWHDWPTRRALNERTNGHEWTNERRTIRDSTTKRWMLAWLTKSQAKHQQTRAINERTNEWINKRTKERMTVREWPEGWTIARRLNDRPNADMSTDAQCLSILPFAACSLYFLWLRGDHPQNHAQRARPRHDHVTVRVFRVRDRAWELPWQRRPWCWRVQGVRRFDGHRELRARHEELQPVRRKSQEGNARVCRTRPSHEQISKGEQVRHSVPWRHIR